MVKIVDKIYPAPTSQMLFDPNKIKMPNIDFAQAEVRVVADMLARPERYVISNPNRIGKATRWNTLINTGTLIHSLFTNEKWEWQIVNNKVIWKRAY